MSRMDSFGIAAQEAWGDPEETMEFFIPVETVDVNHNLESIEVEETTGTRFPARIERGTRFGEITVAGPVRAESVGRLLYACFGTPTTVGAADPAFVHTFDPAATGKVPLPVSLLVNRTDPTDGDITDRFYDAIVNELTLSVEPNGYMSYQASFVSRDYQSDVAEPSPTYDFSERYPFHVVNAYISVGDFEDSIDEEIPVGSWSMTYSNGIPTDVFILGRRTLWEVKEDNASCETTFTARSDMAEHHRRALADEPEKVRLRLEAIGDEIPDGTVQAGDFRFEVIQHMLEYTDAPASINAAERMREIEVTARGAFNDEAGKFVEVILENTTAAYGTPSAS